MKSIEPIEDSTMVLMEAVVSPPSNLENKENSRNKRYQEQNTQKLLKQLYRNYIINSYAPCKLVKPLVTSLSLWSSPLT